LAKKKIFVSTADMGPQLASAVSPPSDAKGQVTREQRAAQALGVELLELARVRPLSRTWSATRGPAEPAEQALAFVMVADEATAAERERFARMAEDVHAAGEALPGVLRVYAVDPSREAFLTDLWTTGSARDLSALKWSPRRRATFVLHVVRVLDALHGLGMVHGCLCAANVLLDDDLEPVVAEAGTVPVHELTTRASDTTLYTPFAAPEVMEGKAPDVRSDLYSAGRLLEEAVKGDEPSAALQDIIARCTAPDPAARYSSAAELATALEAVVGQLSDAEAPVAPSPPEVSPRVERPATARERPGPSVATAPSRPSSEPKHAWQPPRLLGVVGVLLVVTSVAVSLLVGGSTDLLRDTMDVALVLGVALATTLARPAEDTSRNRGLALQVGLAAGAAAIVFVLQPLAVTDRIAAQRHMHGNDAARREAIAEIVRLGRDFRGFSLASLDLSGMDLAGADLRGVDLSHANLTHARLFGAQVQNANFDGAVLAGADLDQVELQLAGTGAATCDAETRLPRGWRCRDGRLARSP
jgi:serine/threonine-protein kinase